MIRLPRPISTNNLFANVRGKGRVRSERYNQWKWHAVAMLAEQKPLPRHTGPVAIRFEIGEEGVSHAMDADNCLKAYLDCLTDAGVIEGDSRKHVRRIFVEWVPGREGCLCDVWPAQ